MSGHAVNCNRIKMRYAEQAYQEIKDKIKNKYPNLVFDAIGSLGKKNPDDETGDIDIAVVINTENPKERLKEILENSLGIYITEMNMNTTPKVMSIGYLYNECDNGMYLERNSNGFPKNHIVQVDFMLVKNLSWAKWRFQSPDLKNGESKYKADPKVFLMQYMISALPLDMPITYFEDGMTIKTKYKYTLNQEGLFIHKLNYEGKRGKPIKNPTREVYKFITDNPYKVIEYLFPLYDSDPDYDDKTFHCVEKLWKSLHQYYNNESDKEYLLAVEKRFYEEYVDNPKSECKLDKNDFICKYYGTFD